MKAENTLIEHHAKSSNGPSRYLKRALEEEKCYLDYAVVRAACVYRNVAWSACDPTTFLRTKRVAVKVEQANDCPRYRVLTKDCRMEDLSKGVALDVLNVAAQVVKGNQNQEIPR